jgi:heme/copper-type cytochrome/quinol oxidase subunit 3
MTAPVTTFPELAPPAPPARPRLLVLGTALAAVASAVVFAGLLGVYLTTRADVLAAGDAWLPEGVTIPLTPGNMAMVTLTMSAVTIHWALYAIGTDDRVRTYLALGVTMLLGVCYLNGIAFGYSQFGAAVGTPFGVLFYAVTGAHLAMAGAAIVFVAFMTFRTLGGQYSARDREGVAAAVLFWDVMVAIYAVLWYAVYIGK